MGLPIAFFLEPDLTQKKRIGRINIIARKVISKTTDGNKTKSSKCDVCMFELTVSCLFSVFPVLICSNNNIDG